MGVDLSALLFTTTTHLLLPVLPFGVGIAARLVPGQPFTPQDDLGFYFFVGIDSGLGTLSQIAGVRHMPRTPWARGWQR